MRRRRRPSRTRHLKPHAQSPCQTPQPLTMSNPTAAMDFILSERLQNTRLNGVGWCVYVLVGVGCMGRWGWGGVCRAGSTVA